MSIKPLLSALLVLCAAPVWAQQDAPAATEGPGCDIAGPQAPRDIDEPMGTNSSRFGFAPPANQLNLCNIHFHAQAEHKARAFNQLKAADEEGHGGGYQCAMARNLLPVELKAPTQNACKGISPGDTVEVHWVYSSCQVKPGPGLESCLSEQCANPSLRVETQVFVVVNNPSALNFADIAYGGHQVNGYHQARSLPANTGAPIEYLGSTTGPTYTNEKCSAMQVTWSVRPQCAKLDINSLSDWCADNPFGEDHAHGVRMLVTEPALLSPME